MSYLSKLDKLEASNTALRLHVAALKEKIEHMEAKEEVDDYLYTNWKAGKYKDDVPLYMYLGKDADDDQREGFYMGHQPEPTSAQFYWQDGYRRVIT